MPVPLAHSRVLRLRNALQPFGRRDTRHWHAVGDGGTGKTTFVKVQTARASSGPRDRVLISFLCAASLDW